MKRTLSLALALLLLALPLASVAQDLPIVPEKIEVTIAVNRHQNDATTSYDEKAFVKMAEEATNIHVNWIEISADHDTKMAALLAGDMPDAFIGLVSDKMITQNAGLFADLTAKVEALVPNFVNYCAEKGIDWKSYMTYPDGHIYGIMGGYYTSPNNQTDGVPWINQQWLSNLNLKMPSTAQALYDVLVAFRDQDANGNGDPNDEIPMDFCQAHYAAKIWNVTSMFGIPGMVRYQDGKALATLNTDAFFDALHFTHKLVEEGLLNPEGFIQTNEQYNSNLDTLRVGVFCGWGPYTYIKAEESKAQYVPMAPVAAEGYEIVWPSTRLVTAERNDFVINAKSPYVDELLKWWNYLSTDEDMAYFVGRGEEGLISEKRADGLYYSYTPTAEELIAAGYTQYANNIGSSTLAASLGLVNFHPLVFQAPLPVEGSTSMIRKEGIDLVSPYFNGFAPQVIIPADAQEEFSFATEGLTDFVDNFIATSVMEGITAEIFNAFKAQLETYGYSFYIDFYQKALDNAF